MSYKRQSEADSSKWVISEYFFSEKFPVLANRFQLPVVLELAQLYKAFLLKMMPVTQRDIETLATTVARAERLQMLEREATKLEKKVHREKQFNRRVEANAQLAELKRKLEELKKV